VSYPDHRLFGVCGLGTASRGKEAWWIRRAEAGHRDVLWRVRERIDVLLRKEYKCTRL